MNPGLHAFGSGKCLLWKRAMHLFFHIQTAGQESQNHFNFWCSRCFSTFLCKAALEKSRAVLYLVTGCDIKQATIASEILQSVWIPCQPNCA